MFATIRSAFIPNEFRPNDNTPERLNAAPASGKISLFHNPPEEISMTQPAMAPDLQPVWQIMTAFQLSHAYKAAVELELFTKIAEGKKTAAEIAEASGSA